MSKKKIILISILFVYLIYGLFLSSYELAIIDQPLEPQNPEGFYDYSGVLNVHTSLSTGSGKHQEVILAAQNANLDFLIFTDLNVYEKPEGVEGYHSHLLVMVEGEYSYLDSRLLNINAKSKSHLKGPGQSQALIADLLSQKDRGPEAGLFLLSHPFKPGFEWTGGVPVGLDGVEVINLKAMWQNAWLTSRASFFWTLFIYPFNPELSFIRLFDKPNEREINLWDRLSQRRNIIAVAGADAEARAKIFNYSIEFPSYEVLLSLVTNHVLLESELTGNKSSDRVKLNNALKKGQFYLSLDKMANPKGFNVYIKDKEDNKFPMGSELQWRGGLSLYVHLPQKPKYPFETIVYRNGEKMMSSNSQTTNVVLHEPGVYRVKVRVIPTFPLPDGKKWIPWIYSNNLYVR